MFMILAAALSTALRLTALPPAAPSFLSSDLAIPTTDWTSTSSLAACSPKEECNFDDAWACSNPWIVQALTTMGTGGISNYIEDLFSMACVRHDGCYRHGRATYGLTRTQCDDMFYEDMKKKCPSLDSWTGVLTLGTSVGVCQGAALAYYRAVQNYGDSHYHRNGTVCHYDARNENARVYMMHENGKFGDADHRYMWSSGWWVVSSLPTADANTDGLLLLKPSNGRVHVHRPLEHGAVAKRVANHNWSDGWTNARGYRVGKQPYLFILKTSNGTAQVRRITEDGKVGAKVAAYDWSKGWTVTEFYEVGGHTFLFLLKGENPMFRYTAEMLNLDTPGGSGVAKVFRMNKDGTVGPLVKDYNWSSGWSIAKAYSVGSQNFMLFLKTGNGVVHLTKLNNDGSIGDRVASYNWSSGWTTAEVFENGGQTYLFLLKSGNGAAKVYRMEANGTVGELVREYDWRDGWTSVTFYRVNGKLFGLLMKAREGGTS
jgi:hypothetical protein